LTPAESLAALRAPPGFTVELAAAEPLVMDPVAIDWGADGSLWVGPLLGPAAQMHGHHVVLVPPHAVRPYVLRNKTDRTDAKGLLEAVRNDEVRPVPVKSETQQAVVALHRLRSTGLATRTARINTVRGLLREFGVVIPTGARHVVPVLNAVLEDADSGVPSLLRPALAEAAQEIRQIEARLRVVEHQLDAVADQMPVVSGLRSIPGIGLLTATALVATVGDVHRFPSARHFASYLGLTPRERSTGLHRRLGAISKRGDRYVRMLLIHGARAVLGHAKTKTAPAPDRLRAWALQLERTRGHNKTAAGRTPRSTSQSRGRPPQCRCIA
jgi:transposase